MEFDPNDQTNDFFQKYGTPPCETVETFRKEDSIEEGLTAWMFALADHYRFEAISMTKRQIKLLAIFGPGPIWGKTLKDKISLERFRKGWKTKQYNNENKTQVKAFAPYWNKKKIMQTIKAMGRKGNNNALYNDD